MNRAIRAAIVVVAGVAALASASPVQELVGDGVASGRLVGRVVDQFERPLGNVRLFVRTLGRVRRPFVSETTGKDGRFDLGGIPPGAWELAVSVDPPQPVEALSPPFVGSREVRIVVAPGQTLSLGDVAVDVGGLVTGRVFASDGSPLAGAALSAPSLVTAGTTSAHSDENGFFRFGWPSPLGRHEVLAWHREHGAVRQWVDVPFGFAEVDFHLPPALVACVRVVDPDGDPVEGVEIVPVGRGTFSRLESARSDAQGRLELKVPAAGLYELRREGVTESALSVVIDGERGPCIEMRLEPTATISGLVLWDEGLEREELRAHFPGLTPQPVDAASGRFELVGVPFGFGTLALTSVSGEYRSAIPVEVPRGSAVIPVDVAIEPGHDLTIRLFRGPRPLAGQQVWVRGDSPRATWWQESDEDGWVRLSGLPAGTYALELPGGDATTASVPRPDPVVLGSPETGVVIEVVDASGRPVDDAVVQVSRGGRGCGDELPVTRTDIRNLYSASAWPGSYRLRVWGSGHLPVRRAIEVQPSGVTRLRIELVAGPPVELKVTGPGELVPSMARIDVRGELGWESVQLFGRPGADGSLVLHSLPLGEHEVRVSAVPYGSARARVVVPGPPVQFELPGAAHLQVSIPALADEPVAAWLRAFDEAGRSRSFSCCGSGEPLDIVGTTKPRFSLTPGRWLIVVQAADGRSWEGLAAIRPGEVTRLLLDGPGR